MTRLSNLLPFNFDETLASYCSRLSSACGYRHARSFGCDLKFKFLGLAIGKHPDICKFAHVVGMSIDTLSRGIIITPPRTRMTTIDGQRFTNALTERQRLRFCPYCLKEDEEEREGRRGYRAYGRKSWLIKPIRCCRSHNVALVTSSHNPESIFVHDFGANLKVEIPNLESHIRDAVPLNPDRVQTYIEARLAGLHTGAAWLDSLPPYVAARTCEMVGAAIRHGARFERADLDGQEWSACADTGFELLIVGEKAFREFLAGQLQRFYDGKGPPGGRALYGRLYDWLAHETRDLGYDPIRHIMHDVALEMLPLGPGDELFGPVTERRLHSVWSASKQFNIHVNRLQKLAINSGLVAPEHRGSTPDRILLPAAVLEKLATEARDSLDSQSARQLLGLTRGQLDGLSKRGLVVSHAEKRSAVDVRVIRRFLRSNLEAFLTRIEMQVTCEPHSKLMPMSTIASKLGLRYYEVVELAMSGDLRSVAWEKSESGLASVRIDLEEIKRKSAADSKCLSLFALQKEIPTTYKVIMALVADERILTKRIAKPFTRTWQTVVEPESLAAFKREFIPLANLSNGLGRRSKGVKRRLDELSIKPAFSAAGVPFYRREQVFNSAL